MFIPRIVRARVQRIYALKALECSGQRLACFQMSRPYLFSLRDGMSDITRLYVEKHGTPVLGTRIFIRTRQYLDGGHDQFHEVNAVVPEPQNRIIRPKKP